MIDLTYLEHLREQRGGFHTYFFWPVYRKRKDLYQDMKFERLEGKTYKVLTDDVLTLGGNKTNFGPDLIYQELSDDFGVAFGTYLRKGPRDIANSISVLETLCLIPIRFEKAILFEFLKNPSNYSEYRLKEYRGKAPRLQSYFKDDRWNYEKGKNAILTRLEEDARMGLKPYQATFKKQSEEGSVKVFESGALLTDKPENNIEFVTDIIEKVVSEGKGTVALAKKVKIEHLKKAISLRLHTDMVIGIEQATSESIMTFIKKLDKTTGIYGLWNEENQYFVNVQYEKLKDDSKEVSSSYSVSIEPTSIIASPTVEPALEDTLSLFYDIDRHFQIKQEKEVSAK
ncbi:MAG: hypothetical protein ACYDAP_01080 [Thermoplasmataceae archaeon]